jgi:putative sigma-54 modulation protein
VELQIRSTDTKVTEGMREFIDRRMAKLDRLADKVVDAQLELRTETPRVGRPVTTAQLTLKTGKHILRAEEKADEPAKAIDAAIDKLIVQARKYNEKRLARRRKSGEHPMAEMATLEQAFPLDGQPEAATAIAEADDAEIDDEYEDELPLRVKRFSIKPMMVDEAVDQMELLGHDFFLFHNAEEDTMNVVYKRRDGAYGLIAPSKT